MKASLVKALRKGNDVVLKLFGTEIVLVPHVRTHKGGGRYDMVAQTPRPPQIFNVEPIGATLSGITGAGGGITNTEGAQAHTWSYQLTAKYDAEIEIGDTWTNGDTNYRVTAINPFNGYEKTCVVTAIGKDPAYGA